MAETWTYVDSSTVEIAGDSTARYWPNLVVTLTQTTAKYFIITAVNLVAGNTRLTLNGCGVYTVANAAITAHGVTANKAAQGIPAGFGAIVPSANGYVGIDTPSPGAKLDVNQPAYDGYNAVAIRAGNAGTNFGANQILFGYNGTLGYAHAIKSRHHSADAQYNALDFYVWNYGDASTTPGGKHVLTMGAIGVGIGKTYPSYALDIYSAAYPRIQIASAAGSGFAGIALADGGISSISLATDMVIAASTLNLVLAAKNASGNIKFSTGATDTEKMILTSAGKLGVGVSSPAYAIDVLGVVQAKATSHQFRLFDTDSDKVWSLTTISNANFGVYEDATTARLVIMASTGNVGIGVGTAPAKLTVAGGVAISDGMTAPDAITSYAQIYVDSADGDLKVKFGDGTVKTIVVDT